MLWNFLIAVPVKYFSFSNRMAILVGPWLWSRLKYLNNSWMDYHGILYGHSWSPEDECYRLWWSPDFFFTTTRRSNFSLIYLIDRHKNSETSVCPSGWGVFIITDLWSHYTHTHTQSVLTSVGEYYCTCENSCIKPLVPLEGSVWSLIYIYKISEWWHSTHRRLGYIDTS